MNCISDSENLYSFWFFSCWGLSMNSTPNPLVIFKMCGSEVKSFHMSTQSDSLPALKAPCCISRRLFASTCSNHCDITARLVTPTVRQTLHKNMQQLIHYYSWQTGIICFDKMLTAKCKLLTRVELAICKHTRRILIFLSSVSVFMLAVSSIFKIEFTLNNGTFEINCAFELCKE